MEHIGRAISNGKGKSKEGTPDEILDVNIEQANSMELQEASLSTLLTTNNQGGGEIVHNEDLWNCLFGGINRKNTKGAIDNHELRNNREVRRHLIGEAAAGRQAGR